MAKTVERGKRENVSWKMRQAADVLIKIVNLIKGRMFQFFTSFPILSRLAFLVTHLDETLIRPH